MVARTVFRILFAVLVIAALVGVGVYIYNVGVAQGIAAGSTALDNPEGGPLILPYHTPFYRTWGFGFGFFPFGWIFGLLLIILVFSLVRGLFFRGWYGRGWYSRGYWSGMPERSPQDVPPWVEEWHRRMHGESTPPAEPRP
jgi:hypothetical protein